MQIILHLTKPIRKKFESMRQITMKRILSNVFIEPESRAFTRDNTIQILIQSVKIILFAKKLAAMKSVKF